MELKDARVLHITNNLGYGGVQKLSTKFATLLKRVCLAYMLPPAEEYMSIV